MKYSSEGLKQLTDTRDRLGQLLKTVEGQIFKIGHEGYRLTQKANDMRDLRDRMQAEYNALDAEYWQVRSALDIEAEATQ